MKITDEIRAEILRHTDIVDIISESIELRKKGKNFIGLCPFHNDKHPSMNVSPELGIYKCFACGAGGDAISFLVNYHHMSFIDSVKELAKKAGIYIPEESTEPYVKEEVDKKELALKALNSASEYYIKMLNSHEGKIARTFYRDRGFSEDLVNTFLLGYSPDSWDSLLLELKKQNYTEQTIYDAGLTVQRDDAKDDKRYYDRFRNRAIFPIQDVLGKVIGFGARQLNPEDKMGKYINSPQSIVYDKSRTLYGLFQAKNEIRTKKFSIMVEGYADVLSLHQAGYSNSIASSGTAMTIEQLRLLKRYTRKIYISYDADEAGIKAAERAAELALEYGFDVFIVQLPHGEDPDSLVKQHGNKIYQTYLNEAVSLIDFKVMLRRKDGTLESPSDKAGFLRELIQLISKIPDRLQHDDYIRHIAMLLNANESQLQKIYLEKAKQERDVKVRKSFQDEENKNLPGTESKNEIKPINNTLIVEYLNELLPEEKVIITLIITEKKALEILKADYEINKKLFFTEKGKYLFSILNKYSDINENILNLILKDESIENNVKQILSYIALNKEEQSENWIKFSNNKYENDIKRVIRDTIYRLELLNIEREKSELQAISKKETEIGVSLDLLRKIKELDSKKTELKIKYSQD